VERLVGSRVFGIDVAGEGSDETCVSERIGYTCLYVERGGFGTDTQTPAIRVGERIRQRGGRAVVDYNGLGQGTADKLIADGHEVVKFISQGKTDATDASGEYSFVNIRSAAWWNMREILDPQNGVNVALPNDEFLISDLMSPRYAIRTGAKIYVEDKKETRKRLGRSPDTGDSVVMDFWLAGFGGFEAFTIPYSEPTENVMQYGAPGLNPYVSGHSVFESVLATHYEEPTWGWND
jgi:hypothetical protein